jgi:hypothetical protein
MKNHRIYAKEIKEKTEIELEKFYKKLLLGLLFYTAVNRKVDVLEYNCMVLYNYCHFIEIFRENEELVKI